MFPVGEVKPVSPLACTSAGGGLPSVVVEDVDVVDELVSAVDVELLIVSVTVAFESSPDPPQPAITIALATRSSRVTMTAGDVRRGLDMAGTI